MRRYNPSQLEPKWQKIWRESSLHDVDMGNVKNKYYVIPMFPYPSGDLHIGHWYNFAPTDTVARFQRMMGKNVLTTMGFDSFGLPAENAAIERGIQPAKWTAANIATMTKQLDQIGASYDWSHSLTTSHPDYYRWNQWLFLQLYKKGLAYRAKAVVNWCPKDKTVLANEQVVGENNVCERCGTPVVQKELEQWFFKITDYTDQLIGNLDELDWPNRVKTMQANWIGKSQGVLIKFAVDGLDDYLEVFTTRPDTIFGATFMVVAPEHQILNKLSISTEVKKYIKEAGRKTELERKEGEKDKTGVFSGGYAINPATNDKIPIWVADYVLPGYGTGAVMAVPAHDERDHQFAKKHKLPIKKVIEGGKLPYAGEGQVVKSGDYSGMDSPAMREKVTDDFVKKGLAKEQTNYRLHDWLISRQRYWGTPIPIVYCDKCGIQEVPEKDLPVLLPEDVEFELTGRSPLTDRPDFVKAKCPNCQGSAKRETDTMDTFVDSSWYFLRYLDNRNDKAAFNTAIINKWAPVDHYIGGIEHAILHLLYARFITKFLRDNHGIKFDEPFKKLTNQGIILGPDGLKMSKRRGNVVNPDEQVKSYGTDSLRLYLMFMGPYDQGGPYTMGGIAGTRRFLDRVWTLTQEYLSAKDKADEDLEEVAVSVATHRVIKQVTDDLAKLNFNTAIAAMMTFVNELYRLKATDGVLKSPGWQFALTTLTQLLAPFAPHIAEELWQDLGQVPSVHVGHWPKYDEELITEELMTLAVQVNGKVRAEIIVAANSDEAAAVDAAKKDPKIAELIKSKKIKKTFYVPGRLVSLVTFKKKS